MDYISEEAVNIILPLMILFWTLLIKIIVNHNSSIEGIIEEIFRLPGDIAILTTTFATSGILIIYSDDNYKALFTFLILLVGSFIVTLFVFGACKKLIELKDKGKSKDWKEWCLEIFLLLATYTLSGAMLYFSVVSILAEVK